MTGIVEGEWDLNTISGIILVLFVVAAFLLWFIPTWNPANIGGADTEYQRYLELRDHSNCTKEHDQECLGGCSHTYQMCLIRACGDEAVQW